MSVSGTDSWANEQAAQRAGVRAKHAVVTPVTDETYAMLYEGKNIRQAVKDLMARELKAED